MLKLGIESLIMEVRMALSQIKDPVCGMSVDATHTQFKQEHHGKKYGFCSKECMEKFKKNPSQFTNK